MENRLHQSQSDKNRNILAETLFDDAYYILTMGRDNIHPPFSFDGAIFLTISLIHHSCTIEIEHSSSTSILVHTSRNQFIVLQFVVIIWVYGFSISKKNYRVENRILE